MEQTRARYPDGEGFVERDGVPVHWESYGAGEPALLLMPTWEIVHARSWKCQIPYFARHGRVVTFDPRGNGRSDRPREARLYDRREFTLDAVAVLDATGVERAVAVSWCDLGETLVLAAEHPARVAGAVFIAPSLPLGEPLAETVAHSFEDELDTDEGWAKENRRYWRRDWRGYVEFFMARCFTEPHSTKQIEDAVGWGMETDAETMLLSMDSQWLESPEEAAALCRLVDCPALVIHGDEDAVSSPSQANALADALGCPLVVLEGSGHGPHLRDPVKVNGLLRDFAETIAPCTPRGERWTRARRRARRALYVSSPIGLGHARRDLAIVRELRALHPDLEVDWLAQHPVTALLEAEGERIHPASRHLANESAHFQSESSGHALHCFEAWRRMDELLVANFMVFRDVVETEDYDVWIGDEAWELDYHLHENPELKRAAYVWLTDFVGWLPMPDGGERERRLTADYNAEMIEHIARYPRIRDLALFVGDPEDVVPGRFGPGLPEIRAWTEEHFEFPGYVSAFDSDRVRDRESLRAQLGYAPGEQVCIVTVGGSGVGASLLARVIAALPAARERVPALRMVAVAGPRIDPAALPAADGLEVHAYVHDLDRHLAACDLAVVQGGLTTAMELTIARRPFLCFPLRLHFEQCLHVRHRLERHGAGRYMDFERDGPGEIAAAIAEEIGREVDYRAVDPGGAARAAEAIAALL